MNKEFRHKGTGEVVKQYEFDERFYEDEDGCMYPSRFVENSLDWEEIKEKKTYEVLTYKQVEGANLYHLQGEGVYKTKNCNISFLNSDFGDKNPIISVKRLSDGEIFTVGDKTTKGEITEILLSPCGGAFGIRTKEHNNWSGSATFSKVKPLYTTYDGVERFEFQREYWVINDKYIPAHKFTICHTHLEGSLSEPKIWKIFSTEEKAQEYALGFKPCLSLNDLLSVWGKDVDLDFYRKSPLFKNFLTLAKTK